MIERERREGDCLLCTCLILFTCPDLILIFEFLCGGVKKIGMDTMCTFLRFASVVWI